jgi:AraC-like DNA-binding protein
MIVSQNLNLRLSSVGYYVSPEGGAIAARCIAPDQLCFEMITHGMVYGFELEPRAHGAGAVFIHRPGEWTVSKTPENASYSCFIATFDLGGAKMAVDWPRCFMWDDVTIAALFSSEMLFAFHNQELDHGVLGEYILSQFRFRLETSTRQLRQFGVPNQLIKVMAHLEANFGAAISVEDVAAHVGLSASYLHAQFRQHLNQTPHQYLISVRMRAAAHMLVSSDAPIKAIACDVGYPNTESFCRAFKKKYIRTAAAHRRLYRHYDAIG